MALHPVVLYHLYLLFMVEGLLMHLLNCLQAYEGKKAEQVLKFMIHCHFINAFAPPPPPPPRSKHTNLQMATKEVKTTSKIANVHIYIEQAINRIKHFPILKREIPIRLLPLIDYNVVVCSACSICDIHLRCPKCIMESGKARGINRSCVQITFKC